MTSFTRLPDLSRLSLKQADASAWRCGEARNFRFPEPQPIPRKGTSQHGDSDARCTFNRGRYRRSANIVSVRLPSIEGAGAHAHRDAGCLDKTGVSPFQGFRCDTDDRVQRSVASVRGGDSTGLTCSVRRPVVGLCADRRRRQPLRRSSCASRTPSDVRIVLETGSACPSLSASGSGRNHSLVAGRFGLLGDDWRGNLAKSSEESA